MSDSSSQPVVRIRNLHKSFGGLPVLNGLDLEVHSGECLGIMGGSGTGKSVALRHVIGLIQPDSGKVEVFGQDVTAITPARLRALRRRVGFVFQEGALVGWMTVQDNLALPLRERGKLDEDEIQARVAEALETVHVTDSGHKFPSEISGGMKKRVSIARALITRPELVLYDEPNAGLDPEISRSINSLMREVSEKLGVTSLVVEHRIECLRRVADRVLFMHEGKNLVEEPTASFFRPSHPRLKAFLGQEKESIQ